MIYDYHVVLGVIAASFGIAGYVIYIRSILRGFTRPHIFTWLIYVIVDGTIFAAQLAGGGGPGAFVVPYRRCCERGDRHPRISKG